MKNLVQLSLFQSIENKGPLSPLPDASVEPDGRTVSAPSEGMAASAEHDPKDAYINLSPRGLVTGSPPVDAPRETSDDRIEPLPTKADLDPQPAETEPVRLPAAGAIQADSNQVEQEPKSMKTVSQTVRHLVLMAGRAYAASWGPDTHPSSETDPWNDLIDDEGHLLSPGKAQDGLIDFIISSIATANDSADEERNAPRMLQDALAQAKQALGRVAARIELLFDPNRDKAYSLRDLVQAAAAGYSRAGIKAWNHLINDNGEYDGTNDFDDLLARFVIEEIGAAFDPAEPLVAQLKIPAEALRRAQHQIDAVAQAIATGALSPVTSVYVDR